VFVGLTREGKDGGGQSAQIGMIEFCKWERIREILSIPPSRPHPSSHPSPLTNRP